MGKIFLLKTLLIFSFLFLASFVLSADPPPCPCPSGFCCDGCNFRSSSYVCDSWQEYDCHWGTGCSSDLGVITYTQHCSGSSANCNGSITDSGWSVFQNCNSWESCTLSGCSCNSSCLERPTGPAFPYQGSENVLLPVTLIWNAVNGAQSYHYKIEGTTEGVTTTPYITIKDCTLNSSSTYNWQVQACCDSNCNNPGPWSNNGNYWTFTTSLAPQLATPLDNATNAVIPVVLDWCDVETAKSYYLRFYKNGVRYVGPVLYPTIVTIEDGFLASEFFVGLDFLTKNTAYEWEVATCLEENGFKCGENCQQSEDGDKCGQYGPRWKFTTGEMVLLTPGLVSPKYIVGPPEQIPVVNFSDKLKWESGGGQGVFSYRYLIKRNGVTVADNPVGFMGEVPFSFFWVENLRFNTLYGWKVKSCWDENANNCQDEWSEEWRFKTTGAPATFVEAGSGPANNATNVLIPAKLNWDNMPGAAVYKYEMSFDAGFSRLATTSTTTISEAVIEYPIFVQQTSYWWRVKTCADQQGEVCGSWSETRNFTTFKLSVPIKPLPTDNGQLLTSEKYLGWDEVPGAKFYQYTVDYDSNNPPQEETNPDCQNLRGQKVIQPKIVPSNSAFLDTTCLGNYNWWTTACLDKDCREKGEMAGPWRFNLIQGEGAAEKGFVPCGRNYDNPDTLYNEREPCQIKHIFLLVKNILDFILWRLGLIILVLLTIATGVIYYFSMGAPTTMVKVKSLLRAAGIGYGILFLSWLLINWILVLLGFQLGKWWTIIF